MSTFSVKRGSFWNSPTIVFYPQFAGLLPPLLQLANNLPELQGKKYFLRAMNGGESARETDGYGAIVGQVLEMYFWDESKAIRSVTVPANSAALIFHLDFRSGSPVLTVLVRDERGSLTEQFYRVLKTYSGDEFLAVIRTFSE